MGEKIITCNVGTYSYNGNEISTIVIMPVDSLYALSTNNVLTYTITYKAVQTSDYS